MTLNLKGPLLIAGAGKMGTALISGLLEAGISPAQIVIQDPAPSLDVQDFVIREGVRCAPLITSLNVPPSVILVAVKPQIMDAVMPGLAQLAGPETLLLSIAAGRTIESFERYLPAGSAVIRAMPNTPAAIRAGITVCCRNAFVSEAQRSIAEDMLRAVGDVAWVDDEALMDAVTAVSGSGPAYVFYLVEALAEAGVAAGLDQDLAARLARATVAGSGALLAASAEEAAVLRKNVTSPGGTTAAALEVLMAEDGLKPLITAAVLAAQKRSRELAG